MEIFAMGGWETEIADHWHKAGISNEGVSVEGGKTADDKSQHSAKRQYAS